MKLWMPRASTHLHSRKLKLLSVVLLKKNRKRTVADKPEFSTAPAVNPDFSLLTENKFVSNKHWGSITFLEMERMESVFPFITGGEFLFPLINVGSPLPIEA